MDWWETATKLAFESCTETRIGILSLVLREVEGEYHRH